MMNKTKYIGLFLLLLPFGVISYIRNTGNFITDPITLGLTGCVLTMSFIVGVFIMFIYTVAYIIVFCIIVTGKHHKDRKSTRLNSSHRL